MYLAETINTALAECRAVTGDKALIGEFVPRKELVLLDLTKEGIPSSIFDRAFDGKLDSYAQFLRKVSNEICKPIRNIDNELLYLPSQVFAEYIRDKGIDGIIYKSSLTSKKNYVLFYGADDHKSFKIGERIPCFRDAVELKSDRHVEIMPLEIEYSLNDYHPAFSMFN
ncbi:hypothetical protein DMN77_13955 [Paenibacillus sp. 79R4]|nr:hypothetical protein [Paenibacillus sp. 79R4]